MRLQASTTGLTYGLSSSLPFVEVDWIGDEGREGSRHSYHCEAPRITALNNAHASAATQVREHNSRRVASSVVAGSSSERASKSTA